MPAKILALSGSTRSGSLNAKLAAAFAEAARVAGAEPTLISLRDYPLPLYDGDLEEADGVPENARALARLFSAHHGIFIAGPEYNSGITPLLKNTLDWMSRVGRGDKPMPSPFKSSVFALAGASPGAYGTIRGLPMIRQILQIGLGAHVLPEQLAVGQAQKVFDEAGAVGDERVADRLANLAERLIAVSTALFDDPRSE